MKANPDVTEMFYYACVSESGLKEHEISLFNRLKEQSPEVPAEQRRMAAKNFVTLQCGRAVMNATQIGFKVTFGHVPAHIKENSEEAQGALLIFLGCNGKENDLLALDKEIKTEKQKWAICGEAIRILLRSGYTFSVNRIR